MFSFVDFGQKELRCDAMVRPWVLRYATRMALLQELEAKGHAKSHEEWEGFRLLGSQRGSSASATSWRVERV